MTFFCFPVQSLTCKSGRIALSMNDYIAARKNELNMFLKEYNPDRKAIICAKIQFLKKID